MSQSHVNLYALRQSKGSVVDNDWPNASYTFV